MPKPEKIDAQEKLILAATEAIWDALEKRKWKKVDLAYALHTITARRTK